MELTLTNKQRLRMHEDQRIAKAFRQLRDEHPTASVKAICRTLAASGDYTAKSVPGIRLSLTRSGAIVPAKRS